MVKKSPSVPPVPKVCSPLLFPCRMETTFNHSNPQKRRPCWCIQLQAHISAKLHLQSIGKTHIQPYPSHSFPISYLAGNLLSWIQYYLTDKSQVVMDPYLLFYLWPPECPRAVYIGPPFVCHIHQWPPQPCLLLTVLMFADAWHKVYPYHWYSPRSFSTPIRSSCSFWLEWALAATF